MALTDTAVRHAKPRAKDYTLPDYNGLALFVNTKGAKYWHMRFSWAEKQPRISVGTRFVFRELLNNSIQCAVLLPVHLDHL